MTEFDGERFMYTITNPFLIAKMELTFQHELPGFPGAHDFFLEPIGDESDAVFARLQCRNNVVLQSNALVNNLTLLVMSPGILWPHYEVTIDENLSADIGLSSSDDVLLLAIVHPREPITESTANLYSPLVINNRTGLASQLVPVMSESEVGWSTATPFPADRDV